MVESQINQTIRGYTFGVENPSLPSSEGIDINAGPDVMWDLVEHEGSILGFFPPCWYGIYTGRQSVPENSPGSFNFMISPKKGDFSSPESLTIDELSAAMNFVREFINSGRRIAGFNISQERRDRRDQVQSWDNFHIHCLSFPKTEYMRPVSKMPDEYREKLPILTGRLSANLLSPLVKPDEGMVTGPEEVKTDLALPKSGLLLRLSDSITSLQMATLVKKLDVGFRTAHREVYNLFVRNYEQKGANGKPLPYELRNQDESEELIRSSQFDRKVRMSLINLARVLKSEENTEKSKKIFQLPTYSLDMFRDKDMHLYIMLVPYILKRLGVEKAIGVYPQSKTVEGTPNEKRRQRSGKAFEETVTKIVKG